MDGWMIDEDDQVPAPEEVPAEVAAAEAAAEAAPEPEPEPEPEPVKQEPKKLVFKHWVRPKFLQYTYLYDYRHNYYDDVIDYLDRRQKGIGRDIPRAQTWAERALRTYVSKGSRSLSGPPSQDRNLLAHISTGARFHRYHSKSLISRKYSSLGFTSVII